MQSHIVAHNVPVRVLGLACYSPRLVAFCFEYFYIHIVMSKLSFVYRQLSHCYFQYTPKNVYVYKECKYHNNKVMLTTRNYYCK